MSKKSIIKDLRLSILGFILGGVLVPTLIFVYLIVYSESEIVDELIGHQKQIAEDKQIVEIIKTQDILKAYAAIKNDYYKKIDDSELISRMVGGLDDYSSYVPHKKDVITYQNGIAIYGFADKEKSNGYPVVKYVHRGSSASKADINPGDYIIRVNGKSTKCADAKKTWKEINGNGKQGIKVDLTVLPLGSSIPIQVQLTTTETNLKYPPKSISSKLLNNGYGYIKLTSFDRIDPDNIYWDIVSYNDTIKKLYEQNKSPLKGIVLDLRDNLGGDTAKAAYLVGKFFSESKVAFYRKTPNDKEEVIKTSMSDLLGVGEKKVQKIMEQEDIDEESRSFGERLIWTNENLYNVPLVVLINSQSASASEIVTSALQDHKRAVIVGEESYGKGVGQNVIDLDNGKLVLTHYRFYSPNHRSWHKHGIVPDIELKNNETDLCKHSNKELTDEEMVAEIIHQQKDKQLEKALDVLKNPSLYQASLGLAEKEGRIDRKRDKPSKKDVRQCEKVIRLNEED